MAKSYVKPAYGFDADPIVKTPSAADLTAMQTDILTYVDTGKRDIDEITKEILITQGYGSTKGATGKDVEDALDSLVGKSSLVESTRDDGLVLEPASGE